MGLLQRDPHWRAVEPSITIAAALLRPAAPPAFQPRLGLLDRLTGGIRPGDVWVVEGPAGSGVSMLALQLAVAGLRAGRSAAVMCNHLPVPVQLARLLSQTSLVHLSDLWPPEQALDPIERGRAAAAAERLAAEPLRLATGLFGAPEDPRAMLTLIGGGTAPDVLVVDTVAEEFGYPPDCCLRQVREIVQACRSGTALVLGHRTPGATEADRTGSLLFDLADVVLSLGESGDDGLGLLRVAKNRWGAPGLAEDVVAQFHYARFVRVQRP